MKSVFKIMIQDSTGAMRSLLIVAIDANTAIPAAQTAAGVTTQPLQINPFGQIDVEV